MKCTAIVNRQENVLLVGEVPRHEVKGRIKRLIGRTVYVDNQMIMPENFLSDQCLCIVML